MNGTLQQSILAAALAVALVGAPLGSAESASAIAAPRATTAAIPNAQGEVGPIERKLAPNARVAVKNRFGSIRITGVDGDTAWINATDGEGGESVPVVVSDGTSESAWLDVAPGPTARRVAADIFVEVRIPRSASVDLVTTSGDVTVSNLAGSVGIQTSSGTVTVAKAGDVTIKCTSGDVSVDEAEGDVEVNAGSGNVHIAKARAVRAAATSGNVEVRSASATARIEASSGNVDAFEIGGDVFVKALYGNVQVGGTGGHVELSVASGNAIVERAGGDVRVASLSGDTSIQCVKGRVEINNASGTISLAGVEGDVEVTTTSGDVSFAGAIKSGGRYRMKTTSGNVTMTLQPQPPGFTASLTSYSGEIETAYPLTVETPVQQGPVNRRFVGRFGDGDVQLTLSSFSGSVQLLKAAAGAEKGCK